MNLSQGMFLCAGLSTRMRPLTDELPKVLLPLGRKTIFEWACDYFESQQIEKIAVNIHHGAQTFHNFLAAHDFNQEIHTFDEEIILGTGGAVKNMQAFVSQDHFFVMNCDVVTDVDLQRMYQYHIEKKALATLLIMPNPNKKYTPIYLNAHQEIESILSPKTRYDDMGMFGGVTIFSKDIFAHMPLEKEFCLVRHLLEPLCKNKENIVGYKSSERWLDTGEIDLYNFAIKEMTNKPLSWMKE